MGLPMDEVDVEIAPGAGDHGVANLINYLMRTGQLNINTYIDGRVQSAVRRGNLIGRAG